jgi:hypothetical protein
MTSIPPDFHTGELDAGTGGVRDTYKPNLGSIASQAQYTADLEQEAIASKKGLIARWLGALRRLVWGE